MSDTRLRRLPRVTASLFALLTTLLGVPLALARVAAARFGSPHPLAGATPPWNWSLGDVESGLREPLNDQTVIDVVLRVALVVGWLGVAVLAATVVTEVVHQIRHRGMPTPHVRGFGWAQAMARWIVAGLIVVPSFSHGSLRLSALDTSDVALAAPPAHIVELGAFDSWSGGAADGAASRDTSPMQRPTGTPDTPVHVVRPGESVYAIAATLAGGDDGRTIELAHEILDANLGRVMSNGQRFTNPAYIEVGWRLLLPAGVTSPSSVTEAARGPGVHDVSAGETLSSIARDRFGEEAEWVAIWEANRGRTMNDGRVFDDPNLIVPGWQLTIPGDGVAPSESTDDDRPGSSGRRNSPGATVEPAPAPAPTVETSIPAVDVDDEGPTEIEVPDSTDADSTPVGRPSPEPARPTTVETTDAPSGAAQDQRATDPELAVDTVRLDGTVGLERAALLSTGILALATTIRLRRMRSAGTGSRLPEPPAEVAALHRRLLHDPAAEREVRLAAALRAVAAIVVSDRDPTRDDDVPRVAIARLSKHGDVAITLTGDAALPPPWAGDGREWELSSRVPVDEIADDARRAGDPCHALVSLGPTPSGDDLFVDLEAAGVLHVAGDPGCATGILRAIATSLAVAGHAEACHLIGGPAVAVDLGSPNAHVTDTADGGVELAAGLVGATRMQDTTTFELRARRTGGDIWEPAVLLLDDELRPAEGGWPADIAALFVPAHGLALVTTQVPPDVAHPWLLRPTDAGWVLSTSVGDVRVDPVGLDHDDVNAVGALMEIAARVPIEDELEWEAGSDDEPFAEPEHDIVVGLFGGVAVVGRDGTAASFSRSKSVELLTWLVTHRDRATRTAARTALWDLDVRDATFANVVSESRRTLARLVTPPDGEWLARTLTEELPLDRRVVSDADLVEVRLKHARTTRGDAAAVEVLRPVLDLIADAPFAGTDYLWPDAEGITSNLVLLAVGACTELANRALRIGDIETLFAATDRGLRVLPGHEEMIALRMRAHAQAGDTAGVRQEWASYERAILADPWSDGEPAPRLKAVRAELLGPSS